MELIELHNQKINNILANIRTLAPAGTMSTSAFKDHRILSTRINCHGTDATLGAIKSYLKGTAFNDKFPSSINSWNHFDEMVAVEVGENSKSYMRNLTA